MFLPNKATLTSILHDFFEEALECFDPVVFNLTISVEPLRLNEKYVRRCKHEINLFKTKIIIPINKIFTHICIKNKVLLLVYSENNPSSVVNKIYMYLKINKPIFTDFIIKEMCLWN